MTLIVLCAVALLAIALAVSVRRAAVDRQVLMQIGDEE